MTESLNHHQQAELLGIARNIAWVLNSASPNRRETLKNIWLKKVERSNGFDAQFIESFSAAVKSDNLESALQYVFSIIPFSSTGTRYIFHDAAFELRVVKTREKPPEQKKEAQSTPEVESTQSKDKPSSEGPPEANVDSQDLTASTKTSEEKVETSEKSSESAP
jgi:hypothetical protein